MILTAALRDDEGKALGMLILNPKTFATGSEGFHGQGKIVIDGKRYQAQCQLVAIKEKQGEEGGG